ncbi:MAG: ankyrin repeat domain-containing protein [Treponema sp.]|nr:ankyrin repeat domain-containing protein [Treponema sp.]
MPAGKTVPYDSNYKVTPGRSIGSIALGIFLYAMGKFKERKFKQFHHIIVSGDFRDTGDYGDLRLDNIIDIDNGKFSILREYAVRNPGENILFLYIGEEKINEEIPKNVTVERFCVKTPADKNGRDDPRVNPDIDDILERVFEPPDILELPGMDGVRKTAAARFRAEAGKANAIPSCRYIQTDHFRKIRRNLLMDKNLKNGITFIVGENGQGKSALAFQLACCLLIREKIYAPLWINADNEAINRENAGFPGRQPGMNIDDAAPPDFSPLEKMLARKIAEHAGCPGGAFGAETINGVMTFISRGDSGKPLLVIIDGLDLSPSVLDSFLGGISSLLEKIRTNGHIIITSTSVPAGGFPAGSTRTDPPEFSRKNAAEFVEEFSVDDNKTRSEEKNYYRNKILPSKNAAGDDKSEYGQFIKNLCGTFGKFPLMIQSICGLLNEDDINIAALNRMFLESCPKNEMTKIFARSYRQPFKNLSDNARHLLFYLLNFGSGSVAAGKIKKDFSVITENQFEETAGANAITGDKTIDELSRLNFISVERERDERNIRIKNRMLYKALLFEDDFDPDLRKKLVHPEWILEETLILHPEGEKIEMIINSFRECTYIKKEGPHVSPLHVAARFCRDAELVKKIAGLENSRGEKIFDINCVDEKDQKPVHYAAAGNPNPKVIQVLCDEGAGMFNETRELNLPIHYAAEQNAETGVIEKIIELGESYINSANSYQCTPLHYAVRFSSSPGVVNALLKKNADPCAAEENGLTPLHLSVYLKDVKKDIAKREDLITTLLNYIETYRGTEEIKKHINAQDNNGYTPLHYAAAFADREEILTLLLANGARIDVRAQYGFLPIHCAARENENSGTIKCLIDAVDDSRQHAYVNDRNAAGITPLHLAALNNRNPEAAGMLLQHHADPSATDAEGQTPLHFAAQKNTNTKVLEKLYAACPKMIICPDDYGLYPLHHAALYSGSPAIIELIARLMENHDAPLHCGNRDNNYYTSFHAAALNPRPEITKELQRLCKNRNIPIPVNRDGRGKTPLDYALETGNAGVISLVRAAEA